MTLKEEPTIQPTVFDDSLIIERLNAKEQVAADKSEFAERAGKLVLMDSEKWGSAAYNGFALYGLLNKLLKTPGGSGSSIEYQYGVAFAIAAKYRGSKDSFYEFPNGFTLTRDKRSIVISDSELRVQLKGSPAPISWKFVSKMYLKKSRTDPAGRLARRVRAKSL